MTEPIAAVSGGRLLRLNSLKLRLIVSALLLILLLLPAIGLALKDAFALQVRSAAERELRAYVYSILAVAEVDEEGLLMPELLLENQFNVIHSGLYVLIQTQNKQGKSTLAWQSKSFLGFRTPKTLPAPDTGKEAFESLSLDGQPHLIYSFSASFAVKGIHFPLTIHILKDETETAQQIARFDKKVWNWLLVLTALLISVQLAWLLWTLRPLARFRHELALVEQGKLSQLSSSYPSELQAVARQLNTLLSTEQQQRKRYRNALSDLAHSLKTPLAVIQSQAGLDAGSMEQVANINRIIGHQLKRAQSAALSSWHLGTQVSEVGDKLVRTLKKIYREPEKTLTSDIATDAIFKGDEADLAELLGNLLDNACKAAHTRVHLSARQEESRLTLVIEDDGPGIDKDKLGQIFERGIRADSYAQGHGIGLAIVRDLVDSYQGRLSVGRSDTLGGASFTLVFDGTATAKG